MKRFIGRDWCCERIRECREACERGRIGDMYKCLKRIGTKWKKSLEGCMVGVGEFKTQFEEISKDSVIKRVVSQVDELREKERAKAMNEGLNVVPGMDEIGIAMREIKDFPG